MEYRYLNKYMLKDKNRLMLINLHPYRIDGFTSPSCQIWRKAQCISVSTTKGKYNTIRHIKRLLILCTPGTLEFMLTAELQKTMFKWELRS